MITVFIPKSDESKTWPVTVLMTVGGLINRKLHLSKSISRYSGPNTGNVHIIADLYAEVIGILTQSK